VGLSVHRVKLAPGAGVTLAPFADTCRLVEHPSEVCTLDAEALDEDQDSDEAKGGSESEPGDEQRDVLGELEITARLMITGGEEKEEMRLTRADRSLIRQCLLDTARRGVVEKRTVLTRDVRDALRERASDMSLPDARRSRLLEMADAMDIFTRERTARCSIGRALPGRRPTSPSSIWRPTRARAITRSCRSPTFPSSTR
jgi:hypothetical protein